MISFYIGAASAAAVGSAKVSSKLTESEEVADKDAPPTTSADEEAAAAAAAANAAAQAVPGSSKEKDTAKEVLQERIDLYKIDIDENELNLRRNTILGGVFYFDMLQIPPQPKKVG